MQQWRIKISIIVHYRNTLKLLNYEFLLTTFAKKIFIDYFLCVIVGEEMYLFSHSVVVDVFTHRYININAAQSWLMGKFAGTACSVVFSIGHDRGHGLLPCMYITARSIIHASSFTLQHFNPPTGLCILLALISSFFTMSKAISVSTWPIFTIFSPNGRYLCELSRSGPVFPIPQGMLPWQPILWQNYLRPFTCRSVIPKWNGISPCG